MLNITPGHVTPQRRIPVPAEQGDVWALEWVWMFFEWKKFLAPNGIRIAKRPAHSLASVLTNLSWLLVYR